MQEELPVASRPDERRGALATDVEAKRDSRLLDAIDATSGHPSEYQRAAASLALGDREEALGRLEIAATAREPWMVLIGVDPMLAPLRGDERFEALVRRVFATSS